MEKTLVGKLKKEADIYSVVASTSAPDRDNEIIDQNSFKKSLPSYLKNNPVILWAHDYSKPPVAKAVSGRITKNSLELDIEFAETPFAQEVKYLYDNNFLSSFSVGFIPKNWDKDAEGRIVYTETELLETSCVPVPANAQANIMRSVKTAGIDLPNISKLFGSMDQTDQSKDEGQEEKKLTVQDKIKLYRG